MLKKVLLAVLIIFAILGGLYRMAHAGISFKEDSRRCYWNARTATFIKNQAAAKIPDAEIRAKMMMRLESMVVPKDKEAIRERMKKDTMESLDLVLRHKDIFTRVPDEQFFEDIYFECLRQAR